MNAGTAGRCESGRRRIRDLAPVAPQDLALVDAINRCCDARGDDDQNRAALIVESAQFAPHEQIDLCDHFDREAAAWLRANAGIAP